MPLTLVTLPNTETGRVFICHAHDDKSAVARPLASALATHGVPVWLDTEQLTIGDNVRMSVDSALTTCRGAVVILSPAFFRSPWAATYEFDGILNRFLFGDLHLFLVLHNMSRQDVAHRTPSLACHISRSTAEFTLDQISREVACLLVAARIPAARRAQR